MPFRDVLLALVVVLVWGANFVVIKWGVAVFPPLLLTAMRYCCAVLPAIFFVKPPKTTARIVVVYGLAIGFAQFGLLFMAIKLGMPAGLASLVLQLQAFFTMAMAVMLLGERISPIQLVGAAIALLGIAAIGMEHLELTALLPLGMSIAAAFFWGVGNVVTKRAGQVDMLSFVVWSSLVPPLPLFALSLLFEGPANIGAALSNITPFGLGIIAFNGWAATLIGYGLWSVLMKRHKASAVAPFSLLVPVLGIAFGVMILGEHLSAVEVMGSILVFIGLITNVFGPRLLRRSPAAAVKAS